MKTHMTVRIGLKLRRLLAPIALPTMTINDEGYLVIRIPLIDAIRTQWYEYKCIARREAIERECRNHGHLFVKLDKNDLWAFTYGTDGKSVFMKCTRCDLHQWDEETRKRQAQLNSYVYPTLSPLFNSMPVRRSPFLPEGKFLIIPEMKWEPIGFETSPPRSGEGPSGIS